MPIIWTLHCYFRMYICCRLYSTDHWRLKYTEVQSQQMGFTRSPSLSNYPKILNNYLIFTVYYIVYTVFLVLNWLSNLEFRRLKKVVQVVQIGWKGGRGNLDNIQKNCSFFRESVPNCTIHFIQLYVSPFSIYSE